MSKQINLNQLLTNMSRIDNVRYKDLNELIEIQHEVFQKFFKSIGIINHEVTLIYENKQDAMTFNMDCNYGNRLLKKVGVYYHLTDDTKLILRPIFNVISLIDSKEPGLCQISEKLGLNFKLEYIQSFSNTTLELYIHEGKILQPECVIRINETIPYLALGQMITLLRNEGDYRRLNTQLIITESEKLYEPSHTSHQHVIHPKNARHS